MILHLYFARRFAGTFVFVLSIFFGILLLIDLVEQVRRFEGENVGLIRLIGLTLLSVPETLYTILPLITIIAALTLFLSLARTSELVVSRAAGRSAFRSLLGPALVTFLIGVLAVAALNPIVAATSGQFDRVSDELRGEVTSALSLTRSGVWLRQGNGEGQTVIQAVRSNEDGTRLTGVTFLGFDVKGAPTYRLEGDSARLEDGAWRVRNAKRWDFADQNPEQDAISVSQTSVPSSLTASRIADSFGDPSTIPVWELPAFISDLQASGFSARRHIVFLQSQLAMPVLLVAMVLIGAAFTMRHTRLGRSGPSVLVALSIGFGLFFLGDFAQILGETGRIPAMLAAWGPPVAACLLPLGLILHWEDG
ncbi:Lipopolysaccharide export system permease protein LptG [Rhodobacteraceae bacterium THAF1]|uniref:LPS export ABC transporter permease LptG n=1 Tax=Palleronia sp. THAF1 TaxID=2587842 RepID=UPI000F3B0AD1|nr:LPS export ABC transporter permease LptG [Palleronia sp. THAF1]QFU09136.1 Lipopolysaccharide export system permease protein LptG [Palleronia sp. THAF1]VDC24056.1 Lipopolysaccharide export system permease protein LptG [Rhodobacteraceae bacterium THAF1]